ncbi:MAG: general secretion pathway protein GspK [Myxococcales bacterium]|nr:general secretion pathway protein GspK [Myxococcales bacterium]
MKARRDAMRGDAMRGGAMRGDAMRGDAMRGDAMRRGAGRRSGARRRSAGVALLMVITAITVLALVLLEFSGSARTHLSAGTNIRDDIRAQSTADTALALTRACLDPEAWGPLASFQQRLDLNKLCSMMLKVFTESQLDLPFGGLSLEIEGLEGAGLSNGKIEDVELVPEAAFIGLAGLACPGGTNGCLQQLVTVRLMRTLLCDPKVAHVFEREQADGKEYTRADIVANLIDWMDKDDTRVQVDFINGTVADSADSEDSYYREVQGDRYRSKDAPLDSVEELRLIRGINDELFTYLAPQVSVHSAGKIDINKASAQTIANLMKSVSGALQAQDAAGACGEESETRDDIERVIEAYARLVVEARELKTILAGLANPFKGQGGQAQLQKTFGDPLGEIVQFKALMMGVPATNEVQLEALKVVELQARGWEPSAYVAAQRELAGLAQGIGNLVKFESNLYRLRVRARVGNITRGIYAVLKQDGKVIRTLYYREE